VRKRLPTTRKSLTHRFVIGEHRGYVTVGLYEDGTPGEVFIRMAKVGSTTAGLLDAVAILMSIALQHGVPLLDITRKLARTSYQPSGFSGEEFGFASSPLDYVARWLEKRYGGQNADKTA
jgi:ribonucleoside-diphosphate reductase alpha chain